MNDIWLALLSITGCGIGLLTSVLGVYVAILTGLFQVPVETAVSTSLASIIPTTLVGTHTAITGWVILSGLLQFICCWRSCRCNAGSDCNFIDPLGDFNQDCWDLYAANWLFDGKTASI